MLEYMYIFQQQSAHLEDGLEAEVFFFLGGWGGGDIWCTS